MSMTTDEITAAKSMDWGSDDGTTSGTIFNQIATGTKGADVRTALYGACYKTQDVVSSASSYASEAAASAESVQASAAQIETNKADIATLNDTVSALSFIPVNDYGATTTYIDFDEKVTDSIWKPVRNSNEEAATITTEASGALMVFKYRFYTMQIFLYDPSNIYTRRYYSSSKEWTSWYKFSGSKVS